MTIGIDGNEANVEKRVGISEYAYELLVQFERFKIYDLRFKIYLKDRPLNDLPVQREGWNYRVVQPSKLWTQIGLPFDLYTHFPRPDVFFTPTHYAPRFSPIPTVVSIMDLSYIHFPNMFKTSDLYQLRSWTSYSVRNASRIVTISNASKNDIIKEYNVRREKIIVTYPGIKPANKMRDLKIIKEKYNINNEYILFVGTLQPRKNIVRLIHAFSKLPSPIQLVIVGKKGWLYEEIVSAPKKYGVEKNVIFLEFVTDDELSALYSNAVCFVLPSLYEGFGLPVLEAMKYGCPVITSTVSSLPEAGGDAALYVDPENVADIVEKMKLLLENKNMRDDMIKKGYRHIRKFSWEKTAKKTLKVLQEIVEK